MKRKQGKKGNTDVVRSVKVSGKSHLIMKDKRHYAVTQLSATQGGKKETRYLASSAHPVEPFPSTVHVFHTPEEVVKKFPGIRSDLKKLGITPKAPRITRKAPRIT